VEGFWLIGARSYTIPLSSLLVARLTICSTAIEKFSLEDQEVEENFDLSLISSLEIDLVPHLGDTGVTTGESFAPEQSTVQVGNGSLTP
jgi:hypothetical protein